ncbi:MAG TPA: DUF4268 domain-containing protein [Segetibacter sp.]
MFSKQEASQLRKEFWTAFGQYMKPIPSADGGKINWINYKTGEKDVYFKMDAENKSAFIAIEIAHNNQDIQQLYFEQFVQLKNMLVESLGEEWQWELHKQDDYGKTTSKIYKEISGVSILNKAHWPDLISFFKPRIIALDQFWSTAKYGFEILQ